MSSTVPLEKYLVAVLENPDSVSPGRPNAIGIVREAAIPFLYHLHAVEHNLLHRVNAVDFQNPCLMPREVSDVDNVLLDITALDPFTCGIDRKLLLRPCNVCDKQCGH